MSTDRNIQVVGVDQQATQPPRRSLLPWIMLVIGLVGGWVLARPGVVHTTDTEATQTTALFVSTEPEQAGTPNQVPPETTTTRPSTSTTTSPNTPRLVDLVPGLQQRIWAIDQTRSSVGLMSFRGFFDWDLAGFEPRVRRPDRIFTDAGYTENWSWGVTQESVLYAGRGDQPIPAVTGAVAAAFHHDGPPRIAYIAINPQPHNEAWVYTGRVASVGGLSDITPIIQFTAAMRLTDAPFIEFDDDVIVVETATDLELSQRVCGVNSPALLCLRSMAVINRSTDEVRIANHHDPVRLTQDWIVAHIQGESPTTTATVVLDRTLTPVDVRVDGKLVDALVSPNGALAALIVERSGTLWCVVVARTDFSVVGEFPISDLHLSTWSSAGEFVVLEGSTASSSTIWFYDVAQDLLRIVPHDGFLADVQLG